MAEEGNKETKIKDFIQELMLSEEVDPVTMAEGGTAVKDEDYDIESSTDLRNLVAKKLGTYEESEVARQDAKRFTESEQLGLKGGDTLRHILGAGYLKYIEKDQFQPLLEATEVMDQLIAKGERFLDPDADDPYRASYYNQLLEEADRDIINYKVGAALAEQYDTKEEFTKAAVEMVKALNRGETPTVKDETSSLFGTSDQTLSPVLSTGVVYKPSELKQRGIVYDSASDSLIPAEPPKPKPRPEKAAGGSVEKEVDFVKDDDEEPAAPPPGATPEEVADDIPAYLSTGEYVLPANVVRYYGLAQIVQFHKDALAQLQQMEDLDLIENVDENGLVEQDDEETKYLEPDKEVKATLIVAKRHPSGMMAPMFDEGGDVGAFGGPDSPAEAAGASSAERGDVGAFGGADSPAEAAGPSDKDDEDEGDGSRGTSRSGATPFDTSAEPPREKGFVEKAGETLQEIGGKIPGPGGLMADIAGRALVEAATFDITPGKDGGAGVPGGETSLEDMIGIDVDEPTMQELGEDYRGEDDDAKVKIIKDVVEEAIVKADPVFENKVFVPGYGFRDVKTAARGGLMVYE